MEAIDRNLHEIGDLREERLEESMHAHGHIREIKPIPKDWWKEKRAKKHQKNYDVKKANRDLVIKTIFARFCHEALGFFLSALTKYNVNLVFP